jgi:hypothetical protein
MSMTAGDFVPSGYREPLRFSRLRLMGKSAAHFRHGYQPTTKPMLVGSAVHAGLLGGPAVAVWDGVRRGKEYDKFCADQLAGTLVLNAAEARESTGMQAAIGANRDAMRLLDGVREKTILFDLDGRPCRGPPDVVGADFITELKTGETSDPRKFAYKVRDFCYHGQLAWYDHAVRMERGGEKLDHFVVAVEAKPPYVVTVFRLLPPSIEQGRKLIRLWLEQLKNCEASNEWPGYCQSIVDLDVSDTELIYADGDESDVPIS